MRILYHAIDGTGLGHLVRLSSIASAVRSLEPSAHQIFVTNTGHPEFLRLCGLPAIILPEDDAAPSFVIHRRRHTISRAANIRLITRIAAEYDPDVVVFDTYFPSVVVRELHKRGFLTVLILRDCKGRYLRARLDNADFGAFTSILIPHSADEFNAHNSKAILTRLKALTIIKFVGPVVRRDQIHPNVLQAVMSRYRIKLHHKVVLIMCGGGGYIGWTRRFLYWSACAATEIAKQRQNIVVVVITGPFACDIILPKACRVAKWEPHLPLLIARADLVVTHGGYNSVHEVLAAGRRAIVVRSPRKYEDQGIRIDALAKCGRVRTIDIATPLKQTAQRFAQELDRPPFKSRHFNGAITAAAEIVSLCKCQSVVWMKDTNVSSRAITISDKESLRSALKQLPAPRVLIDAARLRQVRGAGMGVLKKVRHCWIRLASKTLNDVSVEANAVLQECHRQKIPHDRLTLSFVASNPMMLWRVAQTLCNYSFHSLVAELPDVISKEIAFDVFEHCRDLRCGFRLDIACNGSQDVLIDQP
jgi:UDP-N-acetylglucosamine--N-acetylmuramyl-(pentapeptide) pyrophosphoryl-undecaprenol N-acetylglucosamine transferase